MTVGRGEGAGSGSGNGGAATTAGAETGGAERMSGGGIALASVVFRGVGARSGRAGGGADGSAGGGAAADAGAETRAAGASRAISGAPAMSDRASGMCGDSVASAYQPAAACISSDNSTANRIPD